MLPLVSLVFSSICRGFSAQASKSVQKLGVAFLATLTFGSLTIVGQTATPPASATNFGSSAVGTATTQTAVTFTVGAAGILGAPLVLTQGTPNLDFRLGTGSSCTGAVSGANCTVNVVFNPIAPGLRRGAVQLTDSAGKVIATAFIYGNGVGPRVAFTPGLISTVAGTVAACANQARTSSCGDGGPATAAQFDLTRGITVDAAGNIFLVDTSDFRVRKIDAATGLISTVAGVRGKYCDLGVIAPTCLDGGPATQGLLTNPNGVAIDGAGNLYITDSRSTTNTLTNNIRKVTASTGIISTVASGQPFMWGITVDRAGDVYFSAVTDNTIRKLTVSTGAVTTVAGNGTYAFSGDGGPATSASFQYPYNVAVDAAENLYITDFGSDRIRKVSAATGIVTTIAGSGAEGYSGDGGPAINAALFGPRGIVEDGSGNLYFSDVGNNVVRKIDAAGIITTVAGGSTYGYTGDGGPAVGALIGGVYQVAVDSLGNLYIPDTLSRVVRKVTATPAPLTFASTLVGTTSTDSPQTVTVSNTGTAALNLAVPASGTNPAITAGYTPGSSGTCPQISASAYPAVLAAGASCTEVVGFHPVAVSATYTGSLTLTDDNLNVAGSTQSVALSGISTGTTGIVTPNITLTVPTTATSGATVGCTTQFSSTSASIPTGNITIYALAAASTTPIALTTVGSSAAAGQSGAACSFTAPAAPGTYSIYASYAGDTNFNSANSANSSLAVVVNALTATTTNLSAVATATAGTAFPVTVRLGNSSSTGTPTGTVTLSATLAGGSASTIANLTAAQTLSSGGYVVQTTLPSAGSYTLTATYAGDATFSTSSGSVPVTVVSLKGTVALTLYVPSNIITGTTITGTVSAVASGTSAAPTGNIVVTAVPSAGGASVTLCTVPAAASITVGQTNCVFTAPAAGTYRVTAVYAGDTNYDASSSITSSTFVTTQLDTTLSVNAPLQVAPTATFIFTVALKSGQTVVPTGNIIVTALGKNTGTSKNLATIPANQAFATGGLQTSVHLDIADFYTITANYSGDPHFKSATGTADLTVGLAFTVLTTTLVQAGTAGTPSTFNVFISGLQQATGSILLSSTIGGMPGPQTSVTLAAASSVSPYGTVASLTFPTAGTYSVQATYAGDSANSPARSTPIALSIVTTASTLKTSGAPGATIGKPYPVKIDFFALGVLVGSPDILLTATPTFGGNPIVFQVSAQASQGQANYTQNFSFVTPGTYTITAVWAGDSLNAGSSAPPYNVVVSAPGGTTPSFTLLFTDPVKASQGIYVSDGQAQPTTTPLALTAYAGFTTPVTLNFIPGRVNKKIAVGLKDATTGALITSTTPVLPGTHLLLVADVAPAIGGLNLPALPGRLPTVLACLFCISLANLRSRSTHVRKGLHWLVVFFALSAATLLSGCLGRPYISTTLLLTATPVDNNQGAAPQTLTVVVNYDYSLSD